MKFFAAIVIFVWGIPAFAGTIVGNVQAQGKPGADADGNGASDGDYASRKYKFVPKVNYAGMHDFVVYLEGTLGTNSAPATNVVSVATQRIAQHGASFTPHVLPVMVGTTVEWPNNDDIYHNVFSMSDAKQFDLGLYKGNPPDKRVMFDKPGRVDVFCSIHENMHCVVLVLQNPYFAVTDDNGNYKIPDVPPGTYKLAAWQERLPLDERQIVVPTNGEVRADFTLTIKNLPQY
jgi:plastocyanin